MLVASYFLCKKLQQNGTFSRRSFFYLFRFFLRFFLWKKKTLVQVTVTHLNQRVTSLNPRVTSSNLQVTRLKARAGRLKA